MKIRNGPNEPIKVDGMVRALKARHSDLSEIPVEYPYHFLREYLAIKGFNHLCKMIRWHGTDGQDLPARTKHFVNLLKMNIVRVSAPSYSIIAKNEAHIRLASSIWYAAHYISYASLVGIVMATLANILAIISPAHSFHVEFIALPVLTIATSICG